VCYLDVHEPHPTPHILHWFYADALGGVKLQVPEAYALQALELHSEDLSGAVDQQLGNGADLSKRQ
jgi:hypothetical protein